jgi:hypothetical protein
MHYSAISVRRRTDESRGRLGSPVDEGWVLLLQRGLSAGGASSLGGLGGMCPAGGERACM